MHLHNEYRSRSLNPEELAIPAKRRERVVKALNFEAPDRAPRDLWTLPGINLFRKEELDSLKSKYPPDIESPGFRYPKGKRQAGTSGRKGIYTDEWGCVWEAMEEGVVGEVKRPALEDTAGLRSFNPPWEILEADWDPADKKRESSDAFILTGTTVRPFERLQFLRGSENLFMDLGYESKDFFYLRDLVHEFFLEELKYWTARNIDGISFMDDWGSQRGLLISPNQWRRIFKPLYADYCRIIRDAGKYVFFHSDGHIMDIYPDLIDIGIHAVNSQLFSMDIEEIGRRFRGKICFWGEIDRQHLLPLGSPADVRAGVMRVRRSLDTGRGGLIAQCEWGTQDPYENIAAVFSAWEEPLADSYSDK